MAVDEHIKEALDMWHEDVARADRESSPTTGPTHVNEALSPEAIAGMDDMGKVADPVPAPVPSPAPQENHTPERIMIAGYSLDAAQIAAAKAAAAGIDSEDLTHIMHNDVGGTFFWGEGAHPQNTVRTGETKGKGLGAKDNLTPTQTPPAQSF